MFNFYVFLKLLPFYLWILATKDLTVVTGSEDIVINEYTTNASVSPDILPQVCYFESFLLVILSFVDFEGILSFLEFFVRYRGRRSLDEAEFELSEILNV